MEADSQEIKQLHNENFASYSHKQIGYFIIFGVGSLVFFLFLMNIYVYVAVKGPDKWLTISIMAGSIVFVAVLALLFSSLSISVTKAKIKWSFAYGFWKKELFLSEVASADVVQNSLLNGFGIRMIGNGWLYNVSGFGAVDLKLKSGSVVRLGSDEPDSLKHAVNAALK